MTRNNDFGTDCFIGAVTGILFLLVSLGVGLIFLTAQQAIGVSILVGLVGVCVGNYLVKIIDNFLRKSENESENK